MEKSAPKKTEAKADKKPKLTDKERHERFLDMAHKAEADERAEAFDEAFDKVVKQHKPAR
jgi:hypothetical protein